MRHGPILAAALLAAVALSGCTGTPAEPEPVDAQSEAPVEAPEIDENEIADNESGLSEFAKALEEKYHYHDYWGNLLSKTLFDAEVQSADVVPSTSGPFGVFGGVFSTVFNGVGFTTIDLPDGSIVPAETEELEVIVTWTDSATITGLELGYRDALSENVTWIETPLESSAAVEIASTIAKNDMPHTSVSKWRFFLAPYAETGPAIFNGTVHVKIVAHRPDVLYLAAPHPDHWGDDTTRKFWMHEQAAKATRVGFIDVEEEEGFGFIDLPNGTIIPPHTRLLTMTIEWVNNDQTTAATNPHPRLCYSPANTRGVQCPDPTKTEEARLTYQVEMNARMADSPYAEQSNWRFLVLLDSTTGPFIQAAKFDGTYTITVVGEREFL